MIKRTFVTTKAEVIGINIETEIAEKREVFIKGKSVSTREILKTARDDTFVPSKVTKAEVCEKKYEISDEDFLKHAHEVTNNKKKEKLK